MLFDDVSRAGPLESSRASAQDWPAVLTTQVARLVVAVNDQTIRTMIERGELPAARVGKLWRIAAEDVWPFVPPGIRATWPQGRWRPQ